MAKFIFTVEDGRNGGVTLSLDKSEGPVSTFDKGTKAARMAKRLLNMAEMETAISAIPAYKLMPSTPTLH
ncbi:hypothetical protein D9M68_679050 [compost metagenome]